MPSLYTNSITVHECHHSTWMPSVNTNPITLHELNHLTRTNLYMNSKLHKPITLHKHHNYTNVITLHERHCLHYLDRCRLCHYPSPGLAFIAIVTTHIKRLHKFSVQYWTHIQPLHTNSTTLDEFNSTQIQPLYTNSITLNELYTTDFPNWLLPPEIF